MSPTEIGAARDRAVVRALDRLTAGADLPDLQRVDALLDEAVAACPRPGRTLFAARRLAVHGHLDRGELVTENVGRDDTIGSWLVGRLSTGCGCSDDLVVGVDR